eukprot:CAMPEP_0114401950 /NCGR_PEP_ID=MMETSP0102-20121206/17629_1 /TAXON_ID=38822 ORGANISM="Pteridomonas danica, Strain PT" /NCGR_SAMPLE_ID=MMETSP0102 /ASSEMBLY_ACC=CAM_ASM_000212 /LENGTH=745 /DNA_ID=CAMNT_0001565279 /DNA_START=14 /DNA_END=2249 /DNA_ORIENTATION=+
MASIPTEQEDANAYPGIVQGTVRANISYGTMLTMSDVAFLRFCSPFDDEDKIFELEGMRGRYQERRCQQAAAPQVVRGEPWMVGVIAEVGGTTKWKHDDGRTTFANQLRNFDGIEMGKNVRQFPLTRTLDQKEVSAPLIVRSGVKLMWESVLKDILDNPEKKVTTSIVTGNPGVGKTRSMDYLLRLLLLRNELVFYDQREIGVVFVFVPPDIHKLDNTYRVYFTENLTGSETWLSSQSGQSPPFYLYNPAHDSNKNGIPLGNLHFHLVIAASPNPKHVKGWWKSPSNLRKHIMPSWTLDELLAVCPSLFKMNEKDVISSFLPLWWKSPSNLRKHIMPSWTLDELLAVCPSLFKMNEKDVISSFLPLWWKSPSNLRKHIMPSWTLDELLAVCPSLFKMNEKDVISHFCRYGGVLRAIVGDTKVYESGLRDGVADLPPNTMENMLLENMVGIDSENVHISSGLYRIEPDPNDWSCANITFASPYTCALVAGRFWETIAQEGRGSDRRYTEWFELLCMLVLAKGGTFQVRPLLAPSGNSNETLNLELDESNLVFMTPSDVEYMEDDDANDDAEEHGKLNANDEFYKRWASNDTANIILAPRTTNLPVVDCVSLPHQTDCPMGFQVTVSGTHPISYGECKKILDAFPDGTTLNLYFVVPTHVADHFKRQAFKGGTKKPSLHDRVNQNVIGITIDHVLDFSKLYQRCVGDKLARFMEDTMYNSTLKRFNSDISSSSSSSPKRAAAAAGIS